MNKPNFFDLVESAQDATDMYIEHISELPNLTQALRAYQRFNTADILDAWYDRLLDHAAREEEYGTSDTEAKEAT